MIIVVLGCTQSTKINYKKFVWEHFAKISRINEGRTESKCDGNEGGGGGMLIRGGRFISHPPQLPTPYALLQNAVGLVKS